VRPYATLQKRQSTSPKHVTGQKMVERSVGVVSMAGMSRYQPQVAVSTFQQPSETSWNRYAPSCPELPSDTVDADSSYNATPNRLALSR
jgi:hypothetical protein